MHMKSLHLRFLALFVCFTALLTAQDNAAQQAPDTLTGSPVVVSGDSLFYFYGSIGPFSPAERSEAAGERIENLAGASGFDATRFSSLQRGAYYDVVYGDTVVLSVTPEDAAGRGLPIDQVATEYATTLSQSLADYRSMRNPITILKIAGSILLVIVVLWVMIWLINRAFRRIKKRASSNRQLYEDRLKLHKYKLITVQRQKQIIIGAIDAVKWILILFLAWLTLPIMFSIVPLAEGVATKLIGYVTYPLRTGFWAVVAYIPKLIVIVLVLLVMRVVVRVMRSLSQEVASGKVELKGFYPDWAIPTYKMLRFVVYIFTFVLIFPLLPGSGSAVFQGVSVFLGLLISLGSQSAISNIISGLVITYMRAFNIGDRVRIGETTGDVLERSLLVTKVRTIKNEDVTIPNSNILTSHTVNFTSAQSEQGLILHTTVTIGYDVPWRKVRQLLIDSALKTKLIESQPEPFVLQTSLDDFYVSYQLNAYTRTPSSAARIYSELHSNIQDIFAAADVEIMSPHYRVNRQMLDTTIPTEFGEGESMPPPGSDVQED